MSHFLNFITVFMGFFAIMNPLANTPIFISLTAGQHVKTKRAIAKRAIWVAFIVITVFSLAGKLIFELFGITLPAFRVAGGIIVFLIGFEMLQGHSSNVHNPNQQNGKKSRDAKLSIAVSPLAVPILAGPGTITTAMNFASGETIFGLLSTIATFFILCWVTFYFFIFGEKLVNYLGKDAIGVITRIMGLILAVIGTNMLIEGIYGAIRAFGQS